MQRIVIHSVIYTECRYAECRGALQPWQKGVLYHADSLVLINWLFVKA